VTVKLRRSLLYLDLTASLDTGNSLSIGISPINLLPKCGRDSFLGVAEVGYDKLIVRAPKNKTSKNAELMKCPECQSTHVNKNGQKKGKQNYICVGCGRQFIDCYQPHKGYLEEVKRECLKMYVNGMGFRAIERICMSTSHQHYKLGKASRRIAP
jgi:transposase-like protein